MVDLLLLNVSNLPQRPIYPYGFVLVSAVARRFGLSVERVDLLRMSRDKWRPMLRRILDTHRPRAVGIHLRQVDSLVELDYWDPETGEGRGEFFPVQQTRALVDELRTCTEAPIVMGGFGFTTHAPRLFEYLGADYGVQGDPDGFFERFDDVLARRDLTSVPGLMFREGGQSVANARGYYGPSPEREYTEAVFDDVLRFYGHPRLYGPDPPALAIEVLRGCPFRCYFCSEPHVKGRRIAPRDLDVVQAELEFLIAKDVRHFWFVASELNVEGAALGQALAERVRKLQERFGGPPITWSAYSLPRLTEAELRELVRSGYIGHANDALSLDDDNLKRGGIPYRSEHAIRFLKAASLVRRERAAEARDAEARGAADTIAPGGPSPVFALMLGNAHLDAKTLPVTLEKIAEHRLNEDYESALLIEATRVFELDGKLVCGDLDREGDIISFDRKGPRAPDLLLPSYHYPRLLVEALGSPREIHRFCQFVSTTFMSTAHRKAKDWSRFLARTAGTAQVARWVDAHAGANAPPLLVEAKARLEAMPAAEALAGLLTPDAAAPAASEAALWLLNAVFRVDDAACRRVADFLNLPIDNGGAIALSEYRLMDRLYARYDDIGALFADVARSLDVGDDAVETLYLRYVIHRNNVILRSDYRPLLFQPRAAGAPAAAVVS